MSKLDGFFDKALQLHSRISSSHLGDRSQYIGASDIASCPRKVVLSRLRPVPHDTKTLMRFARGHLAEDLLAQVFDAGGATFIRQPEIIHHTLSIRCHIDFLFFSTRHARLHLVEVKSTNGIPCEPYPQWTDQLHLQLGLLQENNPDTRLGGSILAVDLNAGTWKEFNGFAPDSKIYRFLVDCKGRHILSALREECKPDTEPGTLCGHCAYRPGCPSHFSMQPVPKRILAAADAYESFCRQKEKIEAGMDVLKNEILAYTGTETSFSGQEGTLSITTNVCPESTIVDSRKLRAEYPEIYRACSKSRKGSTRLEVKRIWPAPVPDMEKVAV
jgi:CRISPR-associated exonuclease Cas4